MNKRRPITAMPPSPGIYLITNLINGKRYVGASTNMRHRWYQHRCERNRQPKMIISKAIKKYGIESFWVEVLELCLPWLLPEREQFWVAEICPEYNKSAGGLGPIGHRHSEETKRILSIKSKAQWERMTEAQRSHRVSNNLKGPGVGHPVSDAMRKILSDKYTGTKLSEERKKKIGEGCKLWYAAGNKKRWRVRSIQQLCPETGAVVATYRSIREAAKSVGACPSLITGVARNRKKKHCGFGWQYTHPESETNHGNSTGQPK